MLAALLRDKHIGPLEGFRSKAGWPFTSEIVLKFDDEAKNWKLEFDFGDDKNGDTGEIVSIEHYGESAGDKTLFREFGFTPEAVVAAAERSLDN